MYPTGGGVGIIGIYKALRELRRAGLGDRGPAPAGRGPGQRLRADRGGVRARRRRERALAGGQDGRLRHHGPKALGDFLVLDAVYATGGTAIAVNDEALLADQREVARGWRAALICPEGAACVTAVRRLRESGWLSGTDEVVVLNTGTGLKYPETMA